MGGGLQGLAGEGGLLGLGVPWSLPCGLGCFGPVQGHLPLLQPQPRKSQQHLGGASGLPKPAERSRQGLVRQLPGMDLTAQALGVILWKGSVVHCGQGQ